MKNAIIPGSYDPVTAGHYDLVRRAAEIFDRVTVVVSDNGEKHMMFDADERTRRCREAFACLKNVEVIRSSELVADIAAETGSVIVKGARNGTDLDYEYMLAHINSELAGVETLVLPASAEYAHISSTLVRDLIRHGADASKYLPEATKK